MDFGEEEEEHTTPRITSDVLALREALVDPEIAARALHTGNGLHTRSRFYKRVEEN